MRWGDGIVGLCRPAPKQSSQMIAFDAGRFRLHSDSVILFGHHHAGINTNAFTFALVPTYGSPLKGISHLSNNPLEFVFRDK